MPIALVKKLSRPIHVLKKIEIQQSVWKFVKVRDLVPSELDRNLGIALSVLPVF